jgi:large subunit ribosomal protein L16
MLLPAKTKWRKSIKGRRRNCGVATSRTELAFGEYGLKSLGTIWLTAAQIEAARKAILHSLRKKGKVWFRIFPHKPVTAKSGEVPMGVGKGMVDYYVAPIKKGTILFELGGIEESVAREAFRLANHKLPVKTQFIKR